MVDFTTLHPFDFDRNLFNFLVCVLFLRRRRRLDKCSQDLKNYIEMIELQHYSYDDPTYACRMCFSDIEKGAKTAVELRSINTRLRSSAGITATDMSVDRHHSIDVVCIT